MVCLGILKIKFNIPFGYPHKNTFSFCDLFKSKKVLLENSLYNASLEAKEQISNKLKRLENYQKLNLSTSYNHIESWHEGWTMIFYFKILLSSVWFLIFFYFISFVEGVALNRSKQIQFQILLSVVKHIYFFINATFERLCFFYSPTLQILKYKIQ